MHAVEIALAKKRRLMAELEKLNDFLSMAHALEREAMPEASIPAPPKAEALLEKIRSIKERVEECIMDELKQYGARSTKELLDVLMAKGIDPAPSVNDIGDKRNALSTMLSKAKERFTNDRAARVWRIAEPTNGSKETKT